MKKITTAIVIPLLALMFIPSLVSAADIINITSSSSFNGLSKEQKVQILENQITILTRKIQAIRTQRSIKSGSSCLLLNHRLEVGATDGETNGEVSEVQRFLRQTGDYTYPKITGYFGPVTKKAVTDFQLRTGIIQSTQALHGDVGPKTRAMIQKKSCVQYIGKTPVAPAPTPTTPVIIDDNELPQQHNDNRSDKVVTHNQDIVTKVKNAFQGDGNPVVCSTAKKGIDKITKQYAKKDHFLLLSRERGDIVFKMVFDGRNLYLWAPNDKKSTAIKYTQPEAIKKVMHGLTFLAGEDFIKNLGTGVVTTCRQVSSLDRDTFRVPSNIHFIDQSGVLKHVRTKSRDTRRVSDLGQLQIALATYADDHEYRYPSTLSKLVPDYMATAVSDPSTNKPYVYKVNSSHRMYVLGARLEDEDSSFLVSKYSDVDGIVNGINCNDTNHNGPNYCVSASQL